MAPKQRKGGTKEQPKGLTEVPASVVQGATKARSKPFVDAPLEEEPDKPSLTAKYMSPFMRLFFLVMACMAAYRIRLHAVITYGFVPQLHPTFLLVWFSPLSRYPSALYTPKHSLPFLISGLLIVTTRKVIHEFDPWFNFRATEYLVENGLSKFFSW